MLSIAALSTFRQFIGGSENTRGRPVLQSPGLRLHLCRRGRMRLEPGLPTSRWRSLPAQQAGLFGSVGGVKRNRARFRKDTAGIFGAQFFRAVCSQGFAKRLSNKQGQKRSWTSARGQRQRCCWPPRQFQRLCAANDWCQLHQFRPFAARGRSYISALSRPISFISADAMFVVDRHGPGS